MRHLDHHNILTDWQHGFGSRRSYESQLISTIQRIAEKLKSGKDQIDVILLDFAKSFDKVPHSDYFINFVTMESVENPTMDNIFLVFKNTTGASWRVRVSEAWCTFYSTTRHSVRSTIISCVHQRPTRSSFNLYITLIRWWQLTI